MAHLNAAQGYAQLSYATRLKVGAVLIRDDRILSVGYNGMPSGVDNSCEDLVFPPEDKVKKVGPNEFIHSHTGELVTKPGLVHAEMNVIAFAAKNGVSTKECIMVITHSPCYECSKLIIQAGISKVFYETEYRLTEGLDFLRDCGVEVERIYGREEETREASTS